MDFVEIGGDTDAPCLLNLANVLLFQRGPKGEAIAVSITGAAVEIPDTYERIRGEAMSDIAVPLP